MPRGRPKGSKSKAGEGYAKRTKKVKRKYGVDAYRNWGKLGGNPVLLKGRTDPNKGGD